MTKNYDVEWNVLLSLCFSEKHYRGSKDFRQLLGQSIDWGYLLTTALSHRLLPGLAQRMEIFDLWVAAPVFVRKHLQNQLFFNRQRNAEIAASAENLAEKLEADDIAYSFTKGAVLAPLLYEGNGERQLGDIDVVVLHESREQITRIMNSLGFLQGETCYIDGVPSVKPFSRQELIQYAVSPDHLPHFAKAESETYGPGTMVDFSHTVSWHGSGIEVPLTRAFADAEAQPLSIGGPLVRVLSPGWLFAWVIFHAFREAWFVGSKKFHKDVSLLQFRDVLRLWEHSKNEIVSSGIVDILRQGKGLFPLTWFLAHFDRVFESELLKELGLHEDLDEHLLNFGSISTKGPLVAWSGTMTQRLRHTDRLHLFNFRDPQAVNVVQQ